MNIALFMILALLAAFGLAEAVRMAVCGGRRERCGYYVVPLYGGAAGAEALLRRSIARARWNGGETMLILDMGADAESLAITEDMMRGSGLFYCRQERFFDALRELDAMRR